MTDSQQDMQKQEAGATAPDGDAPKKVNVALRVYGVLMMLMGILDTPGAPLSYGATARLQVVDRG